MKKRILTASIAVVAAVCFTSCGSKTSEIKDLYDSVAEKIESKFVFSEYNPDFLFTNGVTPFKSDGSSQMGFVDKNGNYVIEPKFSNAQFFTEDGLARVEQNMCWGYINTDGKYVIEPKFGNANDFDENDMALVFYEGRHGFIDKKGKWVIENKYTSIGNFAENGLAKVGAYIGDEHYYGFIDRTGNEVIAPKFGGTGDGYGCGDFAKCGLAAVYSDGKYGFIDKTGNFVIEPQFMTVSDFGDNGLAFARTSDNKSGYINTSGEFVFTFSEKYVYSGNPFDEHGLAKISMGGRPVIIDEAGNKVIDKDIDDISDFDENGIAVVKSGGKYGFIDKTGEFVIEPAYKQAYAFANGYARVKLDEGWGFIDDAGNMVVEPAYYRATDMYADGYSVVIKDSETYDYAIIDINGNIIVD